MPEIKLNDISLYYEVYGKGAPLLLISGLGSDSSSWLGVVGELSSIFKVIIFDNRGSGRSDIGLEACSISLMAKDSIKLLDSLQIKQAHVVGHSMGGYIAQEIAINYPERVNKLILEGTAIISSSKNNSLLAKLYVQLKKEGHTEAWIKNWIPWLFSPRTANDVSFINTFIKNYLNYPYLQKADGFKNQIEAIAAFDMRDKLATIKAKTLILEGKEDILITPKESEDLAKNIPQSTFKLLDGVAHTIHIENPRLFTDVVMEFINSEN